MFDGIAPRYDLLNRLSSLGLDRGWRRKLVDSLAVDGPGRVLDLATGTADVALAIARRHPQVSVVGADPSAGMLAVGREKVATAGLGDRIELVEADALALPFADDHFDAACIAFGIRNVPDRPAGLAEMGRVVRPGGVVSVLELTEPRGTPLAPLARLHVHAVVPALGALLSGADAYRYLRRSIAAFPPPPEFARIMEDSGLRDVRFDRLGPGAAALWVGRAP